MSSSVSSQLGAKRLVAACASCARGARRFTGHYREFLLEPGTLFTAAAAVLLLAAIVVDPAGSVSSSGSHSWLYIGAAFVGSVYIWFSAVQGIRERDFTADIPVSLATIAAIAIGQFSAAAVVAVLLLVGGLLEEFVAARAGKALDDLETLLPDLVTVRRQEGEILLALADVRPGDLVLVRPGERIAVDGPVRSGTGSVDEAAITGESVPVDKDPGDEVFAGTLNGTGALEILAGRVGEETTLGQIRRLVEQARERKAPIERILDRYAILYTPAAIVLAVVLWLATGDPLRGITMLIVFCPCVMVLATPTALVASIGNAALRGSLIKQGATVEAAAKVDTVLFDKTGTLTLGHPRLVSTVALNDLAPDELLALAAGAEKFSEHPLGRALVRAARERGLRVEDPRDFEALPGAGVRARVGARSILVGRATLLEDHGEVTLPADHAGEERLAGALADHGAAGASVIALVVDQQPAGLFAFEDEVRPEAKRTVARLRELGIGVGLVSGDRRATAQRIAAQLGIDEVHAEVMPAEKAAVIEALQAQGRRVAFVGDGINDGPALATADVGVAMGLTGTDLALETASIALLADDLANLPHLLGLSRRAMHAIRQNLGFSLGVLTIAVALTIVGILRPVSGALLHELSSIPVIANSARLITLRQGQ
ncbi:MAG: heavy metal translocating P-type ATPase [Solirubrobacteraceae bacterium]